MQAPLQRNKVGPMALRRPGDRLALQTVLNATSLPKLETLADSLQSGISESLWPIQYGAISSTAGGLVAAPPLGSTVYAGVNSGFYDLSNSHFLVKLPNAGNQALVSWEIYIQVIDPTGSNLLEFYLNEGSLISVYSTTLGGPVALASVTYDPTQHVWFRFREAAGITYWETSVDTGTWTVQGSVPAPLDPRNVNVQMQAGTYATEASATSATFEFVNLPTTADTVGLASATATAFNAKFSIGLNVGLAHPTATALAPMWAQGADAGLAAPHAAAYGVSFSISMHPGVAVASATAIPPVLSIPRPTSPLRTYVVPAESRTSSVVESRTFRVPAESRTAYVTED